MKLVKILIIVLFLTTACAPRQADFDIENKIEETKKNQIEQDESIGSEDDIIKETEKEEPVVVTEKMPTEDIIEPEKEVEKPIEEDENIKIPTTFDAMVEFAPQAPFANWELPFKEACEEASMIMVDRYFNGQNLNESIMRNEILDLVEWEEARGYQVDMSASEVADTLEEYFGLKAETTFDVTIDRIKEELAKGKMIIIPAAGRHLGNPYFQQPGPLYHMLVVRGYDRNEFITNDPGTKRGGGFKYIYQTLINAVHDWNDGDVENGRKVMVLVSK